MRTAISLLALSILGSCQQLPLAPAPPLTKPATLAPLPAGGFGENVRPPQLVVTWGTLGNGIGQFDSPQALAAGRGGDVYVADTGNHRIQEFTSSGAFVRAWGTHAGGVDAPAGTFEYPRGIAVDNKGNVYVADSNNQRVQVFKPDGTFLRRWGTGGLLPGQFINARCIAVDGHGHVYVIDESPSPRVEKFTEDGTFLLEWGARGTEPGKFMLPRGIAVGRGGDIYVADMQTRRIQQFTSDGILVRAWNGPGFYGRGAVHAPAGVATDPQGNVYVVDYASYDVKVFSPTGEFLLTVGSREHGLGQFYLPEGAAVDKHGYIYVADLAHQRIVKFTPLRGHAGVSLGD